MKTRILLYILIGFMSVEAWAQSPKGKFGTFALTNATVVTVTKGTLPNATVVIADGKIVAVGANVTVPANAEVIDCSGKFIYPGMIDAFTQLGLVEVASDPRTVDHNEVGDIIPQIQALTAVNPNSTLIPVTRVNGVTTVLAAPTGDMMPGTAALIHLHGYTPDQMFANYNGVLLNFPNTGRRGGFDRRTDEEIKKASEKAMNKLNEVWDKAIQYHKLDSAAKGKALPFYPEMKALLPVVRGERQLLIEVNASKDITAALEWIKKRKIQKPVLTGVAEGWRVAEEIAKAKIPVIAGPPISMPTRAYDRYDKAYANAGLMAKAGVVVAISSGDSENVRNLPYHAAFAAAYSMGREEALRAVTIVPATIFGLEGQLGSIEPGKVANLFISDGDPFETKTTIAQVFIAGWKIPMVTRQTELYDEFLKRDPGLKKQ